MTSFLSNPSLPFIKKEFNGNPLDRRGRFVNLEYPFTPRFVEVLRWTCSPNPQRAEKKNDRFRLPRNEDPSFFSSGTDCLVWLGHASFFLRLGGKNMLIDPVFHQVPLTRRLAPHAWSAEVFTSLDYLLISHNHQDHCQERSIREVVGHNPQVKVLSGLRMEEVLRPWIGDSDLQTAGWYQQFATEETLSIFFLPARHWSKRSLNDTNRQLWGAFVLQTPGFTLYFGADSGYGKHYEEAAALFPSIDLAVLGIGAYKPEWFMHPNHSSPSDALRGFHDLGARNFLPMHYGTFDLSDEPPGEPLRVLMQLQERGEVKGNLVVPALGEVVDLVTSC